MDEYISKAEAIEAIKQTYCPNCNSYNGSMCRACGYKDCMDIVDDVKAADHRQLAEWLTELKDLREENKVLTSECDRLIKEKGELLSKVSGGDVLRICQLEETIKRYDSENYKLTQELEQLGTDFNNQVSLVGWHEEQEEEYKRLLGKAMKALNDGSCNKDCRQCKWNNNGCDYGCRFDWKYSDEVSALIGETNDEP